MAELELMGLHPDGEHLVLVGTDGQRHRLPIDDALRAAVRHDRPRLEQVRTTGELRPREIQSRLRAGESPGDIALEAGVPVEHVSRYSGPVLAEQAWVAQQARSMTVGRDAGSPTLGDLVVDRLARRGVDPDDLGWSAARRPGEEWEVVLRFRAGERDRVARWRVDLPDRGLHALDDESRWLSETDLGATDLGATGRAATDRAATDRGPADGGARDARRHLSSVHPEEGDARSRVYDIELDALTAGVTAVEIGPAPAVDDDAPPGGSSGLDSSTAEILEGLRASRGVRQGVVVNDEPAPDGPEEPTPAWDKPAEMRDEPPAAHPSAARRRLDASVLPLRAVPPTPVAAPRRQEPAAQKHDVPAPRERRQPAAPRPAVAEPAVPEPAAPEPAVPEQASAEPAGARAPEGPSTPRRPKGRSRRTSVPSWDEIVFGAKPE